MPGKMVFVYLQFIPYNNMPILLCKNHSHFSEKGGGGWWILIGGSVCVCGGGGGRGSCSLTAIIFRCI